MDTKTQVVEALAKVLPDIEVSDIEAKIERPKDTTKGDYAFPVFFLAKQLHQAPQQIAQDLLPKIDQNGFEKIEVVGPYLNFFLDKVTVGAGI